ncbi:nucleoside phosphorylase [Phaeocystidibacter luteus]|uniref:Uridine phosphorylase n=1 Tax=Phaeocystidibacter luteus TaxID=911197 RepID=A0A6N6RM37_9FLAO|nr:nucleoside phosphorylase [Phaeocystidibacter luteus]KAB2814630.1 phosphorylase [Phaeocystidibacter luteus]
MKRNELGPSELILNPDGSVYHLHLLPEDIAPIIITVGDPDRVKQVSDHFDSIELVRQHREFVTHTGYFKGKRITVISTGIGTDNVDIVLNELDALVNIDLKTRLVKEEHTSLTFVRLGTSGALQRDIPLGTWLLSESAFGYDDLLHFYGGLPNDQSECELLQHYLEGLPLPYRAIYSERAAAHFPENKYKRGHTLTMPGFYAPQGRALRLSNPTATRFSRFADFIFRDGGRLTNLEMETAGLYGLSQILGHDAVSISALLANRMNGEFHPDPSGVVNEMIEDALNIIHDWD